MAITDQARQFADALEAFDQEALERIVAAYQRIYRGLDARVQALLLEIANMDEPTAAQVAKLARFKGLQADIIAEYTRFQAYLRTEILNAAEGSFNLGAAQSAQLVEALLAEAGITARLGGLSAGAFEAMVAFLQPGSPLYDRIDLLAGTLADYVRNTLLDAVALGYNPVKTARLIQDAFGRGLTDALRMARTAQLYSSRVAAQNIYQNSEVVDGWIWYAQLDGATCQSCIVMHGTIHSKDELLSDHHNGRCAMLPYIEAFGNPIEQTGIEWFESLPESQQKQILGAGKFEAWKAGKFTLDQLSKEHENDVYGMMRVVTPLKELIP
jgi:hypothetical protein